MTLDDALSCGEVIKVVVKDGYYVFDEASSTNDVHYGLTVNFKNMNGSHRSDVGWLLRNGKREQEWAGETYELSTGDVGFALRWKGTLGAESTALEIYNRESLKGYKIIFDERARILQGRYLDHINEDDKVNIEELPQYEADMITLYLEAKKFEDAARPGEVVAGITHNGVDSLITDEDNSGISPNSVIAAMAKTIQGMMALIRQLYARRVFEYEYIQETAIPIVLLIGWATEETHGTEKVNYVINHHVTVTESGQTEEIIDDIEVVGTAYSIQEDTEGSEAANEYVQ